MAKYSLKEVKESFHQEEPWINIFIFSHITIPLVYFMVNFTKITPNVISILSLILGIFSAFFYANGYLIEGALSYLLSYILDATDGKVARLTHSGKVYGAWFDIFVDRVNLTLITTAIAYHYYAENNSIELFIYNNIFLGLAFIGWESRYNIDLYKIKNNKMEVKQSLQKSIFDKWRKKHRLIKEPISLPEIFLFYMIVSPVLKIEIYAATMGIFFLLLRIVLQQRFWINATKDK